MNRNAALSEHPDSDEPEVRFIQVECRTCGERSPVARDPLKNDVSNGADDWHSDHFDTTGHGRFYQWLPERDAGRVYRL